MTRPASGRLVIVAESHDAAPFRFAAATVIPVETAAAAESTLERLLDEGERGVIAVHEPFFEDLDPALRARCDTMVAPVVMPLPTGSAEAALDRKARLTQMLSRAIGYQITFEEPEP